MKSQRSAFGLADQRPDDAGVFCRLGRLARKLGAFEEAAPAFRRAIALDPALPSAHLGLALIVLEQGDYEGAEYHTRCAVQLEKSEAAYCILGVALKILGKLRG